MEPTEVRVARKQLNEWCLKSSNLHGPAKARLICFADALISTALELAGDEKAAASVHTVVEPLNPELFERATELEQRIQEIMPQLQKLRKTWAQRLEHSFVEEQEQRERQHQVKSKFVSSNIPEIAISEISEEDIKRAKVDVETIARLDAAVDSKLTGYIDKAEMNFLALETVTKSNRKLELAPETLSPAQEVSRAIISGLEQTKEQHRKRIRQLDA